MLVWVQLFIGFLILQRLAELLIAKRNERWMLENGGIEKGQAHYKWFIVVHTLFFISLMSELLLRHEQPLRFNVWLFALFVVVQMGRVWCITSLGRFWNTKIIVLPGVHLIDKGPYKYVSHPNYIIVAIELIVIPLLVGALYTAIVFPLLHLLLLKVRIPQEEAALRLINKRADV
ncbi:isoprenylcysteine carboxyl methyltransferase family protein [Lentibacillus saliphilus]|uniref:isoprenylcysteine carboxyl methyltransferase family protein n=1 Tax=Lentibacillus saliphilus TaxID=2737028 RepID=UPI001C2FFA0B|nr:isoprenylcysteine carboxylmethyltransferase family protein [Lentibacillus saliphilus]